MSFFGFFLLFVFLGRRDFAFFFFSSSGVGRGIVFGGEMLNECFIWGDGEVVRRR